MSSSTSDQPTPAIPTPIVIGKAADREEDVVNLQGSCFCNEITYSLRLETLNDARTSLCHCKSCKKAFGGTFAFQARVPLQCFRYSQESAKPVVFIGTDNGSTIYREFCGTCGSPICYYTDSCRDHFRLVAVGTLDDPSALPPNAEYYCRERAEWLPDIPGKAQFLRL